MILLILVVLLWAAVLAPSAWRHFSERQGVGSIEHFHHELRLLEHAGPKTVAPAYRLHTAIPSNADGTTLPSTSDSSRPKLVLLRPTDAASADVDDEAGHHYERVGVLDRPEPECVPVIATDLRGVHRAEAHRRCTTLLRCLAGVAVSTGLIGIVPGMHLAWVFTGLTGLAALALVGLMAYAKEIEAEQRRRATRRAQGTGWEQPNTMATLPPEGADAWGHDGDLGAPLVGHAARGMLMGGTSSAATRRNCPGLRPAELAAARAWRVGTWRWLGHRAGGTILATTLGGVAQLAERYVRNVEAVGSNPITSTRNAQVRKLRLGAE